MADDAETIAYPQIAPLPPVSLRFEPETQTIWATQAQIAELFQTDVSEISWHITNVLEAGELTEASNLQKMQIAGSAKPVTLYSLDMVISVGYRVNSRTATHFRQWATRTLRAYVEQGYVLNKSVLRASPEKLNKLAAEIRALRSEEKQVYAKVRECFKIGSSDYDPTSKQCKRFYALLQDKFLHAVTDQTSSKIILDRADHTSDNMGVRSFNGDTPTLAEAKIGKNYLSSDELYRLHMLSEQFLLYAESTALAGRNMTMASLHGQLDRLLTLNDYPIFEGWKDYLRDEAVQHAEAEFGRYKQRLAIETAGVEYDEEAMDAGEYAEVLTRLAVL